MSKHSKQNQPVWQRMAIAGAIAGVLSFAAAGAMAGECPADKRVADGQGQRPGATAPKDLVDVVRASTDLSKEPLALNGRLFRRVSSTCSRVA